MSTATSERVERAEAVATAFDVHGVRAQFPILRQTVRGKPLVYLDNAATAQKPQAVIDAITEFYTRDCSNTHRGVHLLAERATVAYEGARNRIQSFLGADKRYDTVFVRGATEAINLVAHSFGGQQVRPGDEVIISEMEHHSNTVPWQLLCKSNGAVLRTVPVDDDGRFMLEEYERMLGPKTRLVAVTHMSNVLGTVTPVRQIVEMAHAHKAHVLLDGAQAVSHLPVDIDALDCDFYAFSGHKVYGPTGIGVLCGKADLLDSMPPYQTGGGMVRSVTLQNTTFGSSPHKFEAGTPDIAAAIGFGAAVDFLDRLGLPAVAAYEKELLAYATDAISTIPRVRLIGTAADKAAILSFVVDRAHPHDVGAILDDAGIATRTGHHCAQPLMQRFRVPATTRVSLAAYNTREEIDVLVEGLGKVCEVFR